MMYSIQFSKDAKAALAGLEPAFRKTIKKSLVDLQENPYLGHGFGEASPGIFYLPLPDSWRLLYRIHDEDKTVLVEYLGKEAVILRREGDSTVIDGPWPRLTREQAAKVVEEGIGKRPDLPSGAEYVRQVKKVWKSLMP